MEGFPTVCQVSSRIILYWERAVIKSIVYFSEINNSLQQYIILTLFIYIWHSAGSMFPFELYLENPNTAKFTEKYNNYLYKFLNSVKYSVILFTTCTYVYKN